MFRLISVLAILFLTTTAFFITQSSFSDGLVAYYSFNQCDARDDTANGSNGQMKGGVSCWCGIEGEGLLFDGVDDHLVFEGIVNKYFTTTDFTISFYIKPEQYSVFRQSLFSKREACSFDQMLDLSLDLNRKEICTQVYQTEYHYFKDLSPALDSTGWMHVALVRSGLQAQTYINGQLRKQSFRCRGVDITNEALLMFSNSPCMGAAGRYKRFKGVLDELRVYGRALSEEEILELYLQYPIENAVRDCVTFAPQKFPKPWESVYLCRNMVG
ncbi:MAG: LamG domain-containing protein [Saprospiraceae bacterium]|nr:LamG domain-containing protein [Saprospiraceae bacterium]